MRILLVLVMAAITGAVAVLIAAGVGTAREGASITPAPAFTPQDLTAVPDVNWITTGGSAYNQRYSDLNQINASNVKGLKVAWKTHLNGSGAAAKYSAEGTPLVFDGVMYMVTGQDDVFALDATNGHKLWTYRSHISPKISTACCGWISRGVALGDGKVFVAQLDGMLVALDQLTGRLLWKAKNAIWQVGETMTTSPSYYDGKVFVGESGGEYGCRCALTAYDATTGQRIWRTYMIPAPGEPGSNTWPHNNEWKHGGAPIWSNPTFDPSTNTLVVTTGNADPYSARAAGYDLYTSSFVAMDINTGKIKWHYQMVHHDIWDYDCPSPTIMFDVTIKGAVRHGIAEACKTAWVYELDRTTGKPLIGIREVKVPQSRMEGTARTQPEPVGQAVAAQCSRPKDYAGHKAIDGKPYKPACIFDAFDTHQFVETTPGFNGGDDWAPMSFNPISEALYTCESNETSADEAIPVGHFRFRAGQSYYGVLYSEPKKGTYTDTWGGTFTALNAKTNRIMWQQKWTGPKSLPDSCYSGSFTTAGNLVFVGHNNGTYQADNAATGKSLWSMKLQYGANAPGMTYSVNGKQYVALYDGGSTGDGGPATRHGDTVYAFALP